MKIIFENGYVQVLDLNTKERGKALYKVVKALIRQRKDFMVAYKDAESNIDEAYQEYSLS